MRYPNTEIRKRAGKTLRLWRLEAFLTQWQVAAALRYSTAQFVSNWERGLSIPPLEALPKLGELFGVAPVAIAELLFDAEERALADERKRWMLVLGGSGRRRQGHRQELPA